MTLTSHRWRKDRPNVLVVACSDGRLQEVTDDFLSTDLGIVRYDRFYAPGGAGALAATGNASVDVYRCEVHPDGRAEFVELD